jgi:hypothetical protein
VLEGRPIVTDWDALFKARYAPVPVVPRDQKPRRVAALGVIAPFFADQLVLEGATRETRDGRDWVVVEYADCFIESMIAREGELDELEKESPC